MFGKKVKISATVLFKEFNGKRNGTVLKGLNFMAA